VVDNIRVVPDVIFVPRREIVRLGNRWIIYLPVDMNELWETIKREGRKVKVYLIVENANNKMKVSTR